MHRAAAAFLASVAFICSLVHAFPLDSRQSKCHPNFEGVGVSVLWNQEPFYSREWVPGAVGANITTTINEFNDAAEFRFEQTNSLVTSYIAKKLGVPANNLVVSVGTNKYLTIAYLSSSDPNHTWDISCNTCGTNAWYVHGVLASGCTVKSVNLGLCAQVDTSVNRAHSAPSFLLQLVTCSATAPNQRFQFWMV
ncbi:hypothetical protein DXG03_007995 [Asterophora parasitica]|uniref:Uncharacterized protein n=1 Tax=Asterophora parasitica TaxID=117018 RepID=A0A9P7FXY2_9AGAR|nr:hypothetical protein DXG03_007995 [Asterophora parasitica]